ncbi:hypothetical protein NDU88_001746 [Pleurodeles waltl]|uniref:Uncharacterized protein n=1 Tax=Pleurodeles waltl TaxID=8319 RepID=A0AAV7P9N1_PLEWA|nr:hypothetical protein NDU88_001746 [Pleurodeles waltl]
MAPVPSRRIDGQDSEKRACSIVRGFVTYLRGFVAFARHSYCRFGSARFPHVAWSASFQDGGWACGGGTRVAASGRVRRAALGVAAAVLACSLPHSPGRVKEVRSSGRAAGRGRGRSKVKAASRPAFKAAGFRRQAEASPHAQKGGAGPAQARIMRRKGREGPIKTRGLGLPRNVGGSELQRGQQVSSSEEGSWKGVSPQEAEKTGLVEVWQTESLQGSEVEDDGVDLGGGEGVYPMIPISTKWPTILEWSTSDSEGEEPAGPGARISRSPSPLPRCRFPSRVYGDRAVGETGESLGGGAFHGLLSGGPGGPVKSGESRAARVPWHEVQAEPRVAGWCTSTGGQKKRTSTADAPDGGWGGTGLAPGDAAPCWEQRLGPSRRGEVVRRVGLEPQQGGVKQTNRIVGIQGGDSWPDETCVLDFDEDSVEEGELIEEREEEDWWAQGGAGPANALSKSFQRPDRCNRLLRRFRMDHK